MFVVLSGFMVHPHIMQGQDPEVDFRIPETGEMRTKLKDAESAFNNNKNNIAFESLLEYDGMMVREVDSNYKLISTELNDQFHKESQARQDSIAALSEHIDLLRADSGSLEQENAELSRRTLLIIALLIGLGAVILFSRLRKQKELESLLQVSDEQKNFTDEQINGISSSQENVEELTERFSDIKKRLLGLASFAMITESGNNDPFKRKASAVVNTLHQAEAAVTVGFGFSDKLSQDSGMESTKLNDIIEQMILLVENSVTWPDGIERPVIKTDLEKILPEISIDQPRIRFVLYHILKNALEALRSKAAEDEKGYRPEMTVSTRKLPTFIQVRIRDNGTGMDDKEVDSILEAFYSGKENVGSIGIGLTKSYEMINEVHKGELIIESDPGSGSDFVIRLPLRRDEA